MPQFSQNSPTLVNAAQYDGTQNSISALLGGLPFYMNADGTGVTEGARGRLKINVGDWLVRIPTTTADLYDDSNDYILSVIPNASFTAAFTATGS